MNDSKNKSSAFEIVTSILSILTSLSSLMYGMASYNLYQLYQKEIELKQVFKFLIANIFFQMVISVLPLSVVCFQSYDILTEKIETLNSLDELDVFQNISTTYLNNQTREFIEFNQTVTEVVRLSAIYIFFNLLTAIGAIFVVVSCSKPKGICNIIRNLNVI